ncbi:MAG: DUF3467 domain-containing protein [bacterium]
MNQEEQKIQVNIPPAVQGGFYANMARVLHTPEEFVIDFVSIVPPHGTVGARVFMSPGHAKRLIDVLMANIKQYETQHGTINTAKEPAGGDIGFNPEK